MADRAEEIVDMYPDVIDWHQLVSEPDSIWVAYNREGPIDVITRVDLSREVYYPLPGSDGHVPGPRHRARN